MATDELESEPPTQPLRSQGDGSGLAQSGESQDIVAEYHHLLASDPELTMPVAAIEALISQMRENPSATAMETVETVSTQSQLLARGVANPLPVHAGASLLSDFLDQTFKQPSGSGKSNPLAGLEGFERTRQHLLANSALFRRRARQARAAIAERGSFEARTSRIVLTLGGSRVVRDVLLRAAEKDTEDYGHARFRVVYVTDPHDPGAAVVARLRRAGIAVAEVDFRAVAAVLEEVRVDAVFVGAEAVTHGGHVVSRLGTYEIAQLAAAKLPPPRFVVFAEEHKFVQEFILQSSYLGDSGVSQTLLDFRSAEDPQEREASSGKEKLELPAEARVDFTPNKKIQYIITETAKMEPNQAHKVLANRNR